MVPNVSRRWGAGLRRPSLEAPVRQSISAVAEHVIEAHEQSGVAATWRG